MHPTHDDTLAALLASNFNAADAAKALGITHLALLRWILDPQHKPQVDALLTLHRELRDEHLAALRHAAHTALAALLPITSDPTEVRRIAAALSKQPRATKPTPPPKPTREDEHAAAMARIDAMLCAAPKQAAPPPPQNNDPATHPIAGCDTGTPDAASTPSISRSRACFLE
jgi:hypothetical protein